ncbi:hypothetical protein ATO13_08601 [Stappia sp. 22II-S9-Z10]|nr:hypothetical protein ATO13_08601 [Stappia sp. 22II-S9-Z10]
MSVPTSEEIRRSEATAVAWSHAGDAVRLVVTKIGLELDLPRAEAMCVVAEVVLASFATLDPEETSKLAEALAASLRAPPGDAVAFRQAQEAKWDALRRLQHLIVLANTRADAVPN